MPLKRRIRGLLLVQGFIYLIAFAPAIVATTRIAWPIIHIVNCRLSRSASNWSRLCAGSPIAPNIAISTAPPQTKTVPPNDHRVKGSPRMRVAQIELNTRPDCRIVSSHPDTEKTPDHTACSVDKTGRGRVVIWIVLPAMFEIMNMSIPSLK